MFFARNFGGLITLGITDEDTEGIWKTFYGEPVPYENWKRLLDNGKPSKFYGTEHLAYVYTTAYGSQDIFPAGKWNTINFAYKNSLCTYEPSVHGQLIFNFRPS